MFAGLLYVPLSSLQLVFGSFLEKGEKGKSSSLRQSDVAHSKS